jgi:hypothetical protein
MLMVPAEMIRIAYMIRNADLTAGNDQNRLYDKEC